MKNDLHPDWDDNPEWTEETEARARAPEELLPPHAVAALTRRGPGRPRGESLSDC